MEKDKTDRPGSAAELYMYMAIAGGRILGEFIGQIARTDNLSVGPWSYDMVAVSEFLYGI